MPRDLIITENITVDSVIDATGDWFVPAGAEDAADVSEMRGASRNDTRVKR